MSPRDERFTKLLVASYEQLTRRTLVPEGSSPGQAADWLYEAPFGLLAHDTSADPVFFYANRTAQNLFGYAWEEFVGLPSRLSAGPEDRQAREVLLRGVLDNGFTDDYTGIRVNKSGRQFRIEQVTVWNLYRDQQGARAGQAALIRGWRQL